MNTLKNKQQKMFSVLFTRDEKILKTFPSKNQSNSEIIVLDTPVKHECTYILAS